MSLSSYTREVTPSYNGKNQTQKNLPLSPSNALNVSKPLRAYKKDIENDPPSITEFSPSKSEKTVFQFGDNILRHVYSDKDLKVDELMGTIRDLEDKIRRLESDKVEASFRVRDQVESAMQELHEQLNANDKLSVPKLKNIIKETDSMLISLMGEIDKLNEIITDKITENDLLKLTNQTLSSKLEDTKIKLKTEYEEKLKRKDEKITSLQQRIEELSREISRLSEVNGQLCDAKLSQEEEIRSLRSQLSESARGTGSQASNQALIQKVEDLIAVNDELNKVVLGKEEMINSFKAKLNEQCRINQLLVMQVEEKNNTIELMRQDLFRLQNHNQMMGQELHTLKSQEIQFTKTQSLILDHEAPTNVAYKEAKEWQRKYENAKADNEKLTKIIVENQKMLNDFRETFAELEASHSKQIEELKRQYETKIKSLLEGFANPPMAYSNISSCVFPNSPESGRHTENNGNEGEEQNLSRL